MRFNGTYTGVLAMLVPLPTLPSLYELNGLCALLSGGTYEPSALALLSRGDEAESLLFGPVFLPARRQSLRKVGSAFTCTKVAVAMHTITVIRICSPLSDKRTLTV